MPRGTTLANVLLSLKAELGYNLTSGVASADDQILYRLIDNEQTRLAADYDWAHLDKYADIAATVGTRNLNFPASSIVLERPLRVERYYNTLWQEIKHGIKDEDYNIYNSDLGLKYDPVQKWRLNSDGSTFEVWPIPATAQTIRFHGQRPLTSLLTAGAYDPAKILDLDDLLIVLYVAANRLSRTKQEDATLMLQRAENRMQMLRASGPTTVQREFFLGGDSSDTPVQKKAAGLVLVAP